MPSCFLFLSAVLSVLLTPVLAEKKPVEIADVVKKVDPPAPFLWSPKGGQFAFREKDSIWIHDVVGNTKKELIDTKELTKQAREFPETEVFDWQNRGVREQKISWSDDGSKLLLLLGGDLFLVEVPGGKSTQLTKTPVNERDGKLSPDGTMVAYRIEHDLYAQEIATGKVSRLTRDGSDTLRNGEMDWVYPEELGIPTAFWWSPDSKRLAYLQFDMRREPIYPQIDLMAKQPRFEPERYPKAGDPNPDVRLGVVDAKGGKTRWMDLGETRDHLLARVHWSPDGKKIAAQRLNRVQSWIELLLADPETGGSTVLLKETDPYWINVGDEFQFLKDGKRFIWGSERDGFRHLYLHEIGGAKGRQLTRGEWVVTSLDGVDEKNGWVYFTSTEASPVERQFYRVKLSGGSPERLSKMAGTHNVELSPANEYYVDTASSLTEPTRRTIYSADGKQIASMHEPADTMEEYQILPTEIVKVKTADGAEMFGRLIKPANFDPTKKYPAIVMIYGGPHAQNVRNVWGGLSWDQALAHDGYVIWQVDNRGTANRGHKWESAVYRNLGAQELADQKDGIKHLLSLGFVDEKRLGMYGWSYGGYMTLFTMTNAPGLIHAGIAGAPVTSFEFYDTIYTERYMGLPSENAENYKKGAPLTKAKELDGNLLLVHNFSDDNVHFQNMLRMTDALQKAGKQFDLMIYPQKAHGVTGAVRKQMLEGMTLFFDRHLK